MLTKKKYNFFKKVDIRNLKNFSSIFKNVINFSFKRVGLIIITVCLLSFGSLWHIYSICALYFSYPTNIFIQTKFDVYNKLLPAISFCTNYANISHGKTSEDLFKILSLQNILKELSIGFEDRMERDLKNDSLDTIIESISLRYYCFTINNSRLRGKKFEIFSFFVE
jgi:hypothetical protein